LRIRFRLESDLEHHHAQQNIDLVLVGRHGLRPGG
jgi:hypothetical protein